MNPTLRSKARRYALQALYQWQISHCEFSDLLAQFEKSLQNDVIDNDYFFFLLNSVVQNLQTLDAQIACHLDRPLEALTPIELSVLRLATVELEYSLDVPYRVAINEALELTKTFGSSDEGFKYVNAVLDSIHRARRSSDD